MLATIPEDAVKIIMTIKKPTCCFRTWMAVVTENQGTASLCHLERKEALENVHSPFNALKHLIWFAYAMDDSVRHTQEDKPRILWVEASSYLKEKTHACNLSLQLLTKMQVGTTVIIQNPMCFHFPTSDLSSTWQAFIYLPLRRQQ